MLGVSKSDVEGDNVSRFSSFLHLFNDCWNKAVQCVSTTIVTSFSIVNCKNATLIKMETQGEG